MAPVQVLQSKTPPIHVNYELGRKLGKGSFGVVYECRNRHTGFAYACKTIDKSRLEDEADIEDVRREIGVLRLLAGHASIVELQDVYEDEDRVYIVMELCEGGDLFDDIKTNGPLPEKHAKGVFRELVSAVAYCHLNSIMHRDIKPENVLFLRPPAISTPDDSSYMSLSGTPHGSQHPPSGAAGAAAAGTAFSASSSGSSMSSASSIALCRPSGMKLADFGLALVMAQGDTAIGLTGSRYYTAPEMVRGKRYGRRADVWSLGVVLCTLLTGRLPFAGKTHEDDEGLKRSILKGSVNFEASVWRPISAVAKDLVRQMLTTDPRRRPKAKHLLEHPWLKDPAALGAGVFLATQGVPGEVVEPAAQQALNAGAARLAPVPLQGENTAGTGNGAAGVGGGIGGGMGIGKGKAANASGHHHAGGGQRLQHKQSTLQGPRKGGHAGAVPVPPPRVPSAHAGLGHAHARAPSGQHLGMPPVSQGSARYLRGVQMWWPQQQGKGPGGAQDGPMTAASSLHAVPQLQVGAQRPILPLLVAAPVATREQSKGGGGSGGQWKGVPALALGSPTTPYDKLECASPEPHASSPSLGPPPSPCGTPLPMPSPAAFQTPTHPSQPQFQTPSLLPVGGAGSSRGSQRVIKRALFPSGQGKPLVHQGSARENVVPLPGTPRAYQGGGGGGGPLGGAGIAAGAGAGAGAGGVPAQQTPSFHAFDSASSRGFSSNRRLGDASSGHNHSKRSIFNFSPIRRDILQRAFGQDQGGRARSKWESTEAQLQRLQQRKQQQQQLMQQQAAAQQQGQGGQQGGKNVLKSPLQQAHQGGGGGIDAPPQVYQQQPLHNKHPQAHQQQPQPHLPQQQQQQPPGQAAAHQPWPHAPSVYHMGSPRANSTKNHPHHHPPFSFYPPQTQQIHAQQQHQQGQGQGQGQGPSQGQVGDITGAVRGRSGSSFKRMPSADQGGMRRLSTPERRLPTPERRVAPVGGAHPQAGTPERRPSTPEMGPRLAPIETRIPPLQRRVPTFEKRPGTPDMRRTATPERNTLRSASGLRSKDSTVHGLHGGAMNSTPVPSMDNGSRVFSRGGPLRGLLSPRTGPRDSSGAARLVPSTSAFFGSSYIGQCAGVGGRENE